MAGGKKWRVERVAGREGRAGGRAAGRAENAGGRCPLAFLFFLKWKAHFLHFEVLLRTGP